MKISLIVFCVLISYAAPAAVAAKSVGFSLTEKAPESLTQLGFGPCVSAPELGQYHGSSASWFQCRDGFHLSISSMDFRRNGPTIDSLTFTFAPNTHRGLTREQVTEIAEKFRSLFIQEFALSCGAPKVQDDSIVRECMTSRPLVTKKWNLYEPDPKQRPEGAEELKSQLSLTVHLQPRS